MIKTRLGWAGNIRAQQCADEAFSRLRPKPKQSNKWRRKPKKKPRRFDKQPTDSLTIEFMQMVRSW